jgi:outer membrane protein
MIARYLFIIFSGTIGVRSLSLSDCIGIALPNSTAVLKGTNDVALAGTQVLAAYGQYLPNVQAAGGYNYDLGNNFYASTGPYLAYTARSAYNYQLTSSINIFTGFYNYSSFKAAKLNRNVAELTLERAKQAIELDITQSFLQVILDRKLVLLDSNNLVVSLQREQQLQMLTDVGRARTDLYQQQAQTSSDQLLLINSHNRLKNDKIILLQKLRIDSADSYELADMAIDDGADAARYGNVQDLVQEGLQAQQNKIEASVNMQLQKRAIDFFTGTITP